MTQVKFKSSVRGGLTSTYGSRLERSEDGEVPKVVSVDVNDNRSLVKKPPKNPRLPQVAKENKKFCPPDDEMLRVITDEVVDEWLKDGREEQERGKIHRTSSQPPVTATDEARLTRVRSMIATGLKAHVETMKEGPFMKRVRLHRTLESLASQLLVQLVSLEPFRAPPERELRKLAAEYCKVLPSFEGMDFEDLFPKYCAIYLQYDDGQQAFEYIFLALQREIERQRRGRFMQPSLLRERLDAAARVAFQDVANQRIMDSALVGVQMGEQEQDGTSVIRHRWQTIANGNCDVFIVIREDENKDVTVLDIRTTRWPNGTTAAQHARAKKSPTYYNHPVAARHRSSPLRHS